MKRMKKLGALALAMVMAASLTVPAMAATYVDIKDVTISISSTIDAGIDDWDFEADTSDSRLYIDSDDVSVTNAPELGDAWGDDIKPKATIVVRIDDDEQYRFDSKIKKTDVTLSGFEGARVTSVSRNTKSKLTVKIELPELEYEEGYWEDLLEIDSVDWDESTGKVYWEPNDNVEYYEVRGYRGKSALTKLEKVTATEYDMSQYFKRAGEYIFKVRGVYDDNKGGWEQDEIDVDKEEAAEIYENWDGSSSSSSSSGTTVTPGQNAAGGQWKQNSVGWWWEYSNGSYPVSTWKLINNKWYYFDAVGYCVLNRWLQNAADPSIWYYCGPDGDMWVNRRTPDGYWVDANGVWKAN